MKWIIIVMAIAIGITISMVGATIFLYGIVSFFIHWLRNAVFNALGVYSFFIGIPVIVLGVYILRKNWKYVAGNDSWYK